MAALSIAVLLTCHNRRAQTCECLEALRAQAQASKLDVYLVDDGSSDGTATAAKSIFPDATIIRGDGSLFWGGGMRLAFASAMNVGYDYYLWLNDDTILLPDAIADLLSHHQQLISQGNINAILVGSTKDPVTNEPTYGGAVRSKKWYSNKLEFLPSSSELKECEAMYGNCVLIPKEVADIVGNIDSNFSHSLGDLDYGLRARKKGCSIWLAPNYIGYCAQNTVTGSWIDTNLTILQRLKKVLSIKGFPLKAWTTFTKRHSGPFWFAYWPLPYIRAVIGYKNLENSPTFTDATAND
ncbi:MAG: glycosyltransferase family 2 protein [Cyanobacteria bacterium J06621_11]